jgi:phage-related protein
MVTRRIIAYKSNFVDFYKSQDQKIQKKIEFVLDLIRFEEHVPRKFFQFLDDTNGIYEIRVITTFKSIRILCFFDEGDSIVLVNSFLKKTQKTPGKEIKLAERLKKEYMNDKYRGS